MLAAKRPVLDGYMGFGMMRPPPRSGKRPTLVTGGAHHGHTNPAMVCSICQPKLRATRLGFKWPWHLPTISVDEHVVA
jgi:hypothetical protein